MSDHSQKSHSADSDYIKFVAARLKQINLRADEKLKRIDELAEIVFTAKRNYRKQLKREAL